MAYEARALPVRGTLNRRFPNESDVIEKNPATGEMEIVGGALSGDAAPGPTDAPNSNGSNG